MHTTIWLCSNGQRLLQRTLVTESKTVSRTAQQRQKDAPDSKLRIALLNWGMGGLTHTNGNINHCKWFQAVAAWLQFEVDLILFSEMQPAADTSDPPQGIYTLDYNAEHTRSPGKGPELQSTATFSNLA